MKDWFEDWFDEDYLALYPHRDDAEAHRVAALIQSRVGLPAGAPALDLACGAGRHQRALAERWWTVGLDLSRIMLRAGREAEPDAPLVRADMRTLPFADGAFALVVNLFTSFGYFRDDAQHQRVIDEVARVTRPGGWFVLDFLNAQQLRRALVPFDVRQVGSRLVEQTRAISPDGRFVRKVITLADEDRSYVERVRLFEPLELRGIMVDTLGGYDGRPHDDSSPRAIVIGRRT
ncbi:MAG: class I SAM-dependent methyltransferase [Gemmatimonadaceae bacterium]|nr:class I SAM-dependent methyltransferase [Gemmatimonadaceae bacterium]